MAAAFACGLRKNLLRWIKKNLFRRQTTLLEWRRNGQSIDQRRYEEKHHLLYANG
jgi:hypothetical protein